jgi:hypothetical protein
MWHEGSPQWTELGQKSQGCTIIGPGQVGSIEEPPAEDRNTLKDTSNALVIVLPSRPDLGSMLGEIRTADVWSGPRFDKGLPAGLGKQ